MLFLQLRSELWKAIVSPIYDYLSATTARDPLADSYETDNVRSGGMHARPVVGGIFIKILADRAIWKKWASGDSGARLQAVANCSVPRTANSRRDAFTCASLAPPILLRSRARQ